LSDSGCATGGLKRVFAVRAAAACGVWVKYKYKYKYKIYLSRTVVRGWGGQRASAWARTTPRVRPARGRARQRHGHVVWNTAPPEPETHSSIYYRTLCPTSTRHKLRSSMRHESRSSAHTCTTTQSGARSHNQATTTSSPRAPAARARSVRHITRVRTKDAPQIQIQIHGTNILATARVAHRGGTVLQSMPCTICSTKLSLIMSMSASFHRRYLRGLHKTHPKICLAECVFTFQRE
jgi:hypothetical protein